MQVPFLQRDFFPSLQQTLIVSQASFTRPQFLHTALEDPSAGAIQNRPGQQLSVKVPSACSDREHSKSTRVQAVGACVGGSVGLSELNTVGGLLITNGAQVVGTGVGFGEPVVGGTDAVGSTVPVTTEVGTCEGIPDGNPDGMDDGMVEGIADGFIVGMDDGVSVGMSVGRLEGIHDGISEGI